MIEAVLGTEARRASKETTDKIKNATEQEAVELAWKQLGWPERIWGRAFWWIVLFLVSLLVWLIGQMNWKWIVAIIAALVVGGWVLRILWRMILAT